MSPKTLPSISMQAREKLFSCMVDLLLRFPDSGGLAQARKITIEAIITNIRTTSMCKRRLEALAITLIFSMTGLYIFRLCPFHIKETKDF
jgi:hypothetical protein